MTSTLTNLEIIRLILSKKEEDYQVPKLPIPDEKDYYVWGSQEELDKILEQMED